MKKQIFFSVGSNMPDGDMRIQNAFKYLSSQFDKCRFSDIYRTMSITGDGKIYFNAVVCGFTTDDISVVNKALKNFELENGRTQQSRRLGEVSIDIDVVIVDGEVLRIKDAAQEYFSIGYNQILQGNDHDC